MGDDLYMAIAWFVGVAVASVIIWLVTLLRNRKRQKQARSEEREVVEKAAPSPYARTSDVPVYRSAGTNHDRPIDTDDRSIDTIEHLQKQATEYKKSGEIEKELRCLKQCVELMQNGGYQPWIDRLWKELFRLRRFEESDREKKIAQDLQIKHNRENAQRHYKVIGDAPYVIESISTCPKCYDLSQHVYSRNPNLQSEYILPPSESDVAKRLYCDLCGCYMMVYPFFGFDGNSEPRPKIKIDYEQLAIVGGERLSKRRAQIEYDWLYRYMPDDAPKSVAGYIKMKKAHSENYERLREKAEERDYILADWRDRWCFEPIENYITED